MSCISVLRIGPFPDDNECGSRLRSALAQHFGTASHSSQQEIITISNKYFAAKVLLHEIGAPVDDTNAAGEDGIILVFDNILSNPKHATSTTASFDAMDAIHDRASTTVGDLLRICVGVGKHEMVGKEYEQEYSRRVLWCLDRGYEYVEVIDLSPEALARGHDERDKEGFARIVEAISGTVWSSAVMEQKKSQQLKQAYASDLKVATAEPLGNEYEPPSGRLSVTMNAEKSDQEREELARRTLLTKDGAENGENVDVDGSGSMDTHGSELEQERALDALEGSVREARRLRELSRSGELSDDERRKRAGDAAVLLMDLMGKIGFDDEESSVDEEKEEKTDDS